MQSVDMMALVAKKWDRDPVQVDVLGSTMTINDPQDVESGADALFEQPASVLVDETKITFQSARQERRERLMELSTLEPMLATGLINPIKYITEKLKAIGEQDVTEWLSPTIQGAASGGATAQIFGAAQGAAPGNGQPISGKEGENQQ
jgi:hypothetical protein